MTLRQPVVCPIDPDDPRAPPWDVWERMSPEERAHLVDRLPSDCTLGAVPTEGDRHNNAVASARFTLDAFFRLLGRRIYISSDLSVYYPGERAFAVDVLAVRDVEPHDREKWVVAAEGKGLDWALEVCVLGDREEDEVLNVERYARLGIEEYFFFDPRRRILRGYSLPSEGEGSPSGRAYRAMARQEGRLASKVLGLDLMLEGDRLRFYYGTALVLEADELIARLKAALSSALGREEAAE
jgi:Uma2 family endonuclease